MGYLQQAYILVRDRWIKKQKAGRLSTIKYFSLVFRTNLEQIWQSKGFIHCNLLDYILACLLVRSKYFTEEDFHLRHVFCNGVIHQYLQVRVNGKWIDADPASGYRNYPLGKHMAWFA